MRTTVIFNAKGGVGKTITTINMAAELAARGKRVVCIDADPQANLTRFFGADGAKVSTLYDVLTSGPDTYFPGLLRETQIQGVQLIPASMDLVLADVRALREKTLRIDAIRDLVLSFAEDDAADVVLIDSPPSFTAATTAALAAADDVIIPIKLDAFSLAGVTELLRQVQGMREINRDLDVAGVLVTMFDGTIVAKETADALRESALPVFGTVVRRTTQVDRSTFERKPLREMKGVNARMVAEEYADVVNEYLGGGAKHGF